MTATGPQQPSCFFFSAEASVSDAWTKNPRVKSDADGPTTVSSQLRLKAVLINVCHQFKKY
jgi:hypothetical protein